MDDLKVAMKLAVEINKLWMECLKTAGVRVARCPSDEMVAGIIVGYLAKQVNSRRRLRET